MMADRQKGEETETQRRFQSASRAAAGASAAQRFDETLEFFRRIGPGGDLFISTEPQFRPFPPSSGAGIVSPEIVRAMSRRRPDIAESGRLSLTHSELPFLERFVHECGFGSGSLHFELLKREPRLSGLAGTQLEDRLTFGRPSFAFRRPNNVELREEHLSFGQKRLLAFFYYLSLGGPVIADELVDGLHFDWIEACVAAAPSRQQFFASQRLCGRGTLQSQRCCADTRWCIRDRASTRGDAGATRARARAFHGSDASAYRLESVHWSPSRLRGAVAGATAHPSREGHGAPIRRVRGAAARRGIRRGRRLQGYQSRSRPDLRRRARSESRQPRPPPNAHRAGSWWAARSSAS
jgi:hypothetical protein